MDTAVTFIFLLSCWTVSSSPSRQSVSFSVVFSAGTHLLVDIHEETVGCGEHDDHRPHHQNRTAGSSDGPTVQIFSSVRVSQDPESPHLLVCLLTGLNSPVQPVLWWLDDTVVTSVSAEGPWTKSEEGYSATVVWEVSAADWRPMSSYWCGTIQKGREYKKKLCSQD